MYEKVLWIFNRASMKIINFWKEEKKHNLLTKEQQELYENVKIYYICKEILENIYAKD